MDYTYRLLAVDDETDILRTNRKYLEARGYQVDSAVCVSEALELLRKQKYHHFCPYSLSQLYG